MFESKFLAYEVQTNVLKEKSEQIMSKGLLISLAVLNCCSKENHFVRRLSLCKTTSSGNRSCEKSSSVK